MAKDLGMIAFGMVQQLKKQVKQLEADVEEIKKSIRKEDLPTAEKSEGSI